MATLCFVTGGTLGDVLPAVALARALARRGHAVRFGCAASLAGWTEGLTHVPLRPDLGPVAAQRHAWAWDPRAERGTTDPGFGVEQHVHRLVDALPSAQTSDLLLVGSTVPGARILSALSGRPFVTFSATPTHYSPDSPGGRWRLGAAPEPPDAARWNRLALRLDGWLRDVFGVAGPPTVFDDAPTIVLGASPALHNLSAPPGHTLVATGAWLWTPPVRGLPDDLCTFLDRSGPTALIALGSQPLTDPDALAAPLLAATRAAGLCTIVLRGWSPLGSDEARDVWEGEVVDHDALLPRVDLVITHGGAGTVERALRHGRPLAVIPFGNDQFYNAERVVALGAGVALDGRALGAPDLPALLDRARGCGGAAARLQARLAADVGVEAAADAVEARLSGGCAPP